MVNYYNKYLKYKKKYLEIKKFAGGESAIYHLVGGSNSRKKKSKKKLEHKREERGKEFKSQKSKKTLEHKRDDMWKKHKAEREAFLLMGRDKPDEFDIYYDLEENILAGMEFNLRSSEMVELELDRIKIVFWVNRKKISAECLDLSKVLMNNYLTAIKWIDKVALFRIFKNIATGTCLGEYLIPLIDNKTNEKGLESALRFYIELKYLIKNIRIKPEKNMLRCKAYKEILMNPTLLKHYNDFCELIDLNSTKKLVGGQRLNSFILYLFKIYKENLDRELVPLFQENTEIRLLFQKILMLGHSDLDWNEKPRDKEEKIFLASQLFNTVMFTLKDFLDDDERVEYVVGEEWERTVYNFCSSDFSLDYTNKNLETIQFEKIESHTLTSDKVNQFQQILGHPLIFQLSEEADLKKIEDSLGLEERNLFEEKIHIPQQEKKKLTRIFTSLVSSTLLHMHKDNLENYFRMLQLLTINDFVSPICSDYLQLLIEELNFLLRKLNTKSAEIKLQGKNSPEKLRSIKAQKYENGQLEFGQVGKEYNLPFAATATENNIILPTASLELWAEEADPMSPISSQESVDLSQSIENFYKLD